MDDQEAERIMDMMSDRVEQELERRGELGEQLQGLLMNLRRAAMELFREQYQRYYSGGRCAGQAA
jgi:hypothetical protein